MYKIIGADQKEYGPISADQIRQWIAEGRVNGQTMARVEGTLDWKPLEKFPEFSFTANPVVSAPPMPADAAPRPLAEVLANGYSLDIMSCFSRAWALFTAHFGTVIVAALLWAVLAFGVSIIIQLILTGASGGHIPYNKQIYFRPVQIILTSLVIGPATGGVYYVYLSLVRGQFASAGEMFTGFQSFQDLYLVKLVPNLLAYACMLPFTLATAAKLGPLIDEMQQHQNTPSGDPMEAMSRIFHEMMSAYMSAFPILCFCLALITYLAVNWLFAVPLVIDRKIGFWSALVTSWKIVHKHWFLIFGLVVLTGLVNVAGACMCCVGLLATVPFGILVFCCAYEDIFGRKTT